MIKTFKTHDGVTHSLIGNVVNGKDMETINQLDKEYYYKAIEYSKAHKCHVFYNLKKFNNRGNSLSYEYSQYFIIPISAYDAELIPYYFNGKATDFWIGIKYCESAPDIDFKDLCEIRDKYVWGNTNKSGYDYEEECAEELKRRGFTNITVTPKSGDQGIDITAWKDGFMYGIQCKYYQGAVSNKAVQEAFAGAKYYHCDIPVVMTNSTFTDSARNLAHEIGVKLWSSNDYYKEV